MNLTIWTGIREYIAAEIALERARSTYSAASALGDEGVMAEAAREVARCQEQSTRMEKSVREAL